MSYDPALYLLQSSIPESTYPITPLKSSIPFWDVPPLATLDPGEGNYSPWDQIRMGGQLFPGLARVRCKKPRRFDKKHPRGVSGATQTYVGFKAATIDIILGIWTQDQLNLLQTLMPMLLAAPGAPTDKLNAVDVYYPALALIGVNRLVVYDVDVLEPGTPKGLWNLKIHCEEWYPPPKSSQLKTVNGSGAYHANTAIKSGTTVQASTYQPPSADLDLLSPVPAHK